MDDSTTLGSTCSQLDSGRWTLVIVGGAGVRSHALPTAGDIVLGRDRSCDVVLDHPRVSRRHARLRIGPSLSIEDLGSRHRTTVRGTQLTDHAPMDLGAGDSFMIGPFSLVVFPQAPADASASGSVIQIDDPVAHPPPAVLVAVARSPVRVLIAGETGVGKELLAAEIHRLSERAGQYVRLNCATFSAALLESELFGHERGAFTGAAHAKRGLLEVAAGGTVFLDEIGELPLDLQAKLLRAIESQEIMRVGSTQSISIDVRFIAATNRDLPNEIARGAFRIDLYYRLAGISLSIPPLSKRPVRIVPLAEELLRTAAARAGRVPPRLSHGAAARLQAHRWPGNVRELRNVMERALVVSLDVEELGAEHILIDAAPGAPKEVAAPPREPKEVAPPPHDAKDVAARPREHDDESPERQRIVDALEKCAGNQTRAAKLLGISRATLSNKIAVYRIPRPRS